METVCHPRWATPRSLERPTLGGEARSISTLIGETAMSWQQQVLDVALEVVPAVGADGEPRFLPDGSRAMMLAYREVIVTVPRQSGKTTFWLTLACHRAAPLPGARPWAGPQRMAFTMQDGWSAHKKLTTDHGPKLINSLIKPMLDTSAARDGMTKGAGNAALLFKGGSRIDVLSSTETSGHGLTLDLAGIDEAFADVDGRREQSLLPTMATRQSPQILVISTAGTDASIYLKRKVELGRAAVEDDVRTGVAYFEWSAPEDGEPFPDGHLSKFDDPETWRRCMPALGHTISIGVVEHALQTMSEGDFRRAYLNQWTASDERVISDEAWLAVCDPIASPAGDLTMAIDISPDRSSSAIAVADDSGVVELIESAEGETTAERIIGMAQRAGARIVLDVGGPAGSLVADIEASGVDLIKMRSATVTQACGSFYDAVAEQKVSVRHDRRLDAAVAHAGKHPVGDAWRWTRRGSGDVTPVVAATLAHWAAKLPREEVPVPRVTSLDDL